VSRESVAAKIDSLGKELNTWGPISRWNLDNLYNLVFDLSDLVLEQQIRIRALEARQEEQWP
jgi:hypothetical protein